MDTTTFTEGTRVQTRLNGEEVTATFVRSLENGYSVVRIGQRTFHRKLEGSAAVITETKSNSEEAPVVFDVNQRFDFISTMVDMVVKGSVNSILVTGSGGLGKSTTVLRQLAQSGLVEKTLDEVSRGVEISEDGTTEEVEIIDDTQKYVVVSGHVTPKSVYRVLYENRDENSLVVFDDADSIFTSETGVNLLKGALNTSAVRRIAWLAEQSFGGDSGLPRTFEFRGKVIFISNRKLSDIPQAVRSRGFFVDVTMTTPEKLSRIENLLPVLSPEASPEIKAEVFVFLSKIADRVYDLNIRTFLQLVTIRLNGGKNWTDLAAYLATTNPNNI